MPLAPAPKGNQYAKGHGKGRPPTYDAEEQAQALLEWSKTDNATALVQFCNKQDINPDLIYDLRDRSPVFAEALKKAKSRIAERLRLKLHDKHKPYNYGLFMAEIGFHDKFHHDYVEGLKDKEAERKSKVAANSGIPFILRVDKDGIGAGIDISTETVSDSDNQSAESGH